MQNIFNKLKNSELPVMERLQSLCESSEECQNLRLIYDRLEAKAKAEAASK